jgi:uncharacterized protein (DUF305 family)
MTGTIVCRVRLLGAALLIGTLALVGCTNGQEVDVDVHSSAARAEVSAQHNAADVTFSQDLIAHHTELVELADMASTRAQHEDVRELAAEISASQTTEIETLRGWLLAWGELLTSDSMPGMKHSPLADMLTDEQHQQLASAAGAGFDTLFLETVMAHHRGAIEMAGFEQEAGSNPQAIDLAREIEASHRTGIVEIERLLEELVE